MRWLAYARLSLRPEIEKELSARHPGCAIRWMDAPEEMREALLHAMPGQFGALVGPAQGMSAPINLAAAIAHDAHAASVILAQPAPSGSLRSRAARAGITQVIALERPDDAASAGKADICDEGSSVPRGPVLAAERRPPAPEEPGRFADLEEVDVQPAKDAAPHQEVPHERQESRLRIAHPAIDEAPPHIEVPSSQGPNPCPVLCIASGRGGVGKSALSCIMAATGARWGLKVALMDFDLASGNDYAYFGLPGPAALDPLGDAGAADARGIAACGRMAAPGVSLWGPCERPENAELVAPLAGALLVQAMRQSDLVIIDAATAWTDAVAQAAQICDRLLLVCPEYGGAASSLSRIGALAVRLGVARTRIVRVVNLADPKKSGETFIDRADVGLEAARTLHVFDGGQEAEELMLEGHAAQLAAQDSDLSRSAAACLAQILQELGRLPDCNEARRAAEQHSRSSRKGFFSRRKEAM